MENKSVIALIVGISAGVVLGLLIAPKKGTELSDHLTNVIKNIGNNLVDAVKKGFESTKAPDESLK